MTDFSDDDSNLSRLADSSVVTSRIMIVQLTVSPLLSRLSTSVQLTMSREALQMICSQERGT